MPRPRRRRCLLRLCRRFRRSRRLLRCHQPLQRPRPRLPQHRACRSRQRQRRSRCPRQPPHHRDRLCRRSLRCPFAQRHRNPNRTPPRAVPPRATQSAAQSAARSLMNRRDAKNAKLLRNYFFGAASNVSFRPGPLVCSFYVNLSFSGRSGGAGSGGTRSPEPARAPEKMRSALRLARSSAASLTGCFDSSKSATRSIAAMSP